MDISTPSATSRITRISKSPKEYVDGLSRFAAALRQSKADDLYLVDVAKDGACLFRAVSVGVYGSEDQHDLLRAAAVCYMRDHPNDFDVLGNVDYDENLPFNAYLDKITQPSQEVGEYVLPALANTIGRPIKLYYSNGDPRIYTPLAPIDVSLPAGDSWEVNIIFRDTLANNHGHYMALLRNQPIAVGNE